MSEATKPESENVQKLVVLKNEGNEPHHIRIEPWANEYCLEPGKKLSVLFQHPKSEERIQLDFSANRDSTVLWGIAGSSYEECEADLSEEDPPSGFPAIEASVRMRYLKILVGCK